MKLMLALRLVNHHVRIPVWYANHVMRRGARLAAKFLVKMFVNLAVKAQGRLAERVISLAKIVVSHRVSLAKQTVRLPASPVRHRVRWTAKQTVNWDVSLLVNHYVLTRARLCVRPAVN